MINVKINGLIADVPPGSSILDACTAAGIYVPTLYHHPDLPPAGKCGICVVKVKGTQFALSCSTKVQPGMIIETNTPDVKAKSMQALSAFDDMPLLPTCRELEDVMEYLTQKKPRRARASERTNAIAFDNLKCINCGRCERACADGQAIGALDDVTRPLSGGECISCGQCTTVCPTGALVEENSVSRVMKALASGKTLVFQCAPSTRLSAGEPFGDPVGTIVTGKIVSAARQMGFRYVFDTNYGADMTIWEEGTELIGRVTNQGVLPMFTSCCPAWVNFVEKLHPDLIPNLSTAKSPHMMLGATIKTYFAEKKGIDPNGIFTVSLMPCTAKKDEILRPQMPGDVDAVLTVREYAKMIEMFGIDWKTLSDGCFDLLCGESTGAAALFGVTGGVMEAAVRFAHEKLTNEKLGRVEYQQWRGFKAIKSATVRIAGVELKIAVCNGVSNARELIDSADYKNYHFIEVMACPCGCISGGGQPLVRSRKEATKRALAIYEIDHQMTGKVTSLDNAELTQMYRDFMGTPGEGRAHKLLHTHYQRQETPLLEMKKRMERMPIVAYGSASGNAARLARHIAGYIGTTPISLNACGLAKVIKKRTVIIVLSTFGDGEVPSNAQKFVEQLEANTDPLQDVQFAICALGSREYPKFMAAGRKVEGLLQRQGARRLLQTVEIDASAPDKGEGAFEAWAPTVVTCLGLKMPEIKITRQYTITTGSPEDPVAQEPMNPLGFWWGVILGSTILTPEGFEPQMRRYSIKLPRGMT
jgi:NADH-quinone oxidoreductase subunit G